MIKKIIIATLITLCNFFSHAQERNPFYVGHSLVNHTMPHFVQELAINAGKQTYYDKQIINGSPLQNNYNNASGAEGTPYTTAFPNGNYNTLVVTEAVPLQNHLTWSDSYIYANNFYNYANNNNNNVPIKFYMFETWHCVNSGIPNSDPNLPNGCSYDETANSTILWHPRLLSDFPLWSGIVSHVRTQNPDDNQIWMVPTGQALYNLTTQINAGNIPGISSFTDLFSDDIHLNNSGNYFSACVMYATIYGESPEGLTSNINDEWGTPYPNMPTPDQALAMQQIAWSTVINLSTWTGVSNTLNIEYFDQKQTFSIYPNPSSEYITFGIQDFIENEEVLIYNSIGILVKKSLVKNKKINISDLSNGLYFINFKNIPSQTLKFIKEK